MKNHNQEKLKKKIEQWKHADRGQPIPAKQVHRTKIEKQAAKDRRRKDWHKNED